MTPDRLVDMARWVIVAALELSLPMIVVSFVVGALMGALQTVLQVQDSILGQVPKLLAVVATLGICLPWMMEMLSELFRQLYANPIVPGM